MRLFPTLVLLAVGSLVACSSESTTPSGDGASNDDKEPTGSGSGSGSDICTGPNCNAATPGSTSGTTEDEGTCPPNSQLLYVVTNTVTQMGWGQTSSGPPITLWSYWPPTNEFTKIGDPPCLADTGVQNMTVDRNGIAWIVGNSDKIYKVDTKDASCVGSITVKSNTTLFYPSIAFVGTTAKTLYLFGAENASGEIPAAQFSKLDTTTEAIEPIGTPTVGGNGSWGTMTSNGNGNVFYLERGFDRVTTGGWGKQRKLFEIDPTSAKATNSYDINASIFSGGGNMGLAYFGTQFYLFMSDAVYKFDPATKATAPAGKPSWGSLDIAGAGQSTCVANTVVAAGTKSPVVH